MIRATTSPIARQDSPTDPIDAVRTARGAVGALIGLLERTPGLHVLVTSRQALRVRGETELSLDALADEPAVQLFVDRARAVSRRFTLTDTNAADVAEVVQRLDGPPLAMELAAARMRVLSAGSLLDRLRSSVDVLRASAGDYPERQRTLRASLDWSYNLLSERDQALLARLAVFAGGWTIEAANAVCTAPDEAEVLEPLASLIDKSLVVADHDELRTEPRVRVLETVRVRAGERLDARGRGRGPAAPAPGLVS